MRLLKALIASKAKFNNLAERVGIENFKLAFTNPRSSYRNLNLNLTKKWVEFKDSIGLTTALLKILTKVLILWDQNPPWLLLANRHPSSMVSIFLIHISLLSSPKLGNLEISINQSTSQLTRGVLLLSTQQREWARVLSLDKRASLLSSIGLMGHQTEKWQILKPNHTKARETHSLWILSKVSFKFLE